MIRTRMIGLGLLAALSAPALLGGQDADVQVPAGVPLQDEAAAPAAPAASTAEPAEQPPAEPWEQSFAAGYGRLLELGTEGRIDEARELGRRLLADNAFTRRRLAHEETFAGRLEPVYGALEPLTFALGLETRTSAQRAEVHYALGYFHAAGGGVQSAEEEFQAVRGLAGPGATRLDATYNLGVLDLQLAEELRDKIPEVHGRTNNALSPGFQHKPEDEEDTLPLARKAYENAREDFVVRLREDWRDADTRANVELIQRRLRELDEIEEERRQDEGQERSDENEQDQEEDPQESSDSSDQGTPSEDESEEQPEGSEETDDEQESEGQEQDSEEDNGEEPEDEEGEEEQADAENPEERFLTEEEMKRLLQELEKHNEKGEELMKMLRGVQQRKGEKDW